MKAIILAAGYATRLFPLTESFPKPLIKIAGKAMIDYIIEKTLEIGIEDIFVVTNDKYAGYFEAWVKNLNYNVNIKIINDKTLSNDDRLGSIGDIQFVIDQEGIDDDVFVICGDNLFEFSLYKAKQRFDLTQKTTIVGFDVQEIDVAKKLWIISINNENEVIEFVEKPVNPPSTLASAGIYFYPKSVVRLLKTYLEAGNNKDAPGNFLAWLIHEDAVFAEIYTEQWYDVGTFENLKSAKEQFGEIDVDIEKLKLG